MGQNTKASWQTKQRPCFALTSIDWLDSRRLGKRRMAKGVNMSKTLLSICPIHHQADAGDPPRCLQCEPNQREAEWLRKKLSLEDVENLTEEDAEIFFRHLETIAAQHSARTN